ncbi:MAG: peptide-N-glycosidase F-related protein [Candidatus Lernaella stagnicola]|nr:peptide-N-glycosidase F-related protein [Candidatus Lernaella stagnicola]
MKQFWILSLLCLIALGATLILTAGCDDDDDDDSGNAATPCETFCKRVSGCGLAGQIDVSDMNECLQYCATADKELVGCVVEAENCEAVDVCYEEEPVGDDDDDDDNDDDTSPPPFVFSCEDLGLPVREFLDAEPDSSLYASAADFTVETLDGEWSFAENFTGCESYLIIQDKPAQNLGWSVGIWERDAEAFLSMLPDNAQVLFVSTSFDESYRRQSLKDLREQIDAYIEDLPPEEQAKWPRRIHYVTDAAREMPHWLGEIFTSPRWGAGIDRLQRIRYIGSYADYTRYDASHGWFAPNLKMAANEPVYYNFEAERETYLESVDATVIPLFTGEVLSDPGWAGLRGAATVTLPDETAMAAFDTLELDLYLGCDGEGEYQTCPDWDYLVELYLCDVDETERCSIEIGRWITTYHREGRWVHDISGVLPLLSAGGEFRFEFYTQQPYEVELNLRLSSQARAERPVESHFLFSGGAFGPDYNSNFEPVVLDVDGDVTRVELATVITGHGGAEPGNCAEFCNTTHHFSINGDEVVREFPEAGNSRDCMDKVVEGTVPNQYGTWWYGRSGWCPGKEVPMVRTDITEFVDLGAENTIEYWGLYLGDAYPSSGASISLKSWVVLYK